jgi:hypothetical protein
VIVLEYYLLLVNWQVNKLCTTLLLDIPLKLQVLRWESKNHKVLLVLALELHSFPDILHFMLKCLVRRWNNIRLIVILLILVGLEAVMESETEWILILQGKSLMLFMMDLWKKVHLKTLKSSISKFLSPLMELIQMSCILKKLGRIKFIFYILYL